MSIYDSKTHTKEQAAAALFAMINKGIEMEVLSEQRDSTIQ